MINWQTDLDLDGAPDVVVQYDSWTKDGRGQGFKPAILGMWLKDNWKVVKSVNGELFRWLRGVYYPAEESIEMAVIASHGSKYQRGRAEDVVNWLSKLPAVSLSRPLPEPYLNLKNGVLNYETMELLPHNPKWLTVVQIPIEWVPGAKCCFVDKFIEEAVAPDSIDLVWEMIGYTLSGTNKFQRSFLLYGPGGNGKSKLLALMNGLLGQDNMCANSLKSLCSNRFRCAQLNGKLANVCGDISSDLVEDTEVFKMLVGGDPIEVEKKGQDPFTMHNQAVLMFSANEFPKVTDHSQGYFERFVMISMPVKFRGTEREIVGIEKLLLKELSGALVRAVEGVRRLNERGRFPIVESGAQLVKEYRETVDSIAHFCGEMVIWDASNDEGVKQKTIYDTYAIWCQNEHRQPKSRKRFWSEWRSEYEGRGLYEIKMRDGYPWVTGVSLRWATFGSSLSIE